MVLHDILQGEISQSLKKLKVDNAEHLNTADIWALGLLERVEEIDLSGIMSSKCLGMMGQDKRVVRVLRGAKVRMKVWVLGAETIWRLCKIEIDELELRDGSALAMELFFVHATGSVLAGRLRMLKVWVHRQDWAVEAAVGTMPFKKLEQFYLKLLSRDTLRVVCRMFGDEVKDRVSRVYLHGEFLDPRSELSGIAELRGLKGLKLRYSKLPAGGLQGLLARAGRLVCLEIDTTDIGTGITADDVNAIIAMESLREVTINGCLVQFRALETLVKCRDFAKRLRRLRIHARIDTESERVAARLEALGMVRNYKHFDLDTGVIYVAIGS